MEVIAEDESGDFKDIPTNNNTNNAGLDGSLDRSNSVLSTNSESDNSEECSEFETDFAKQLKMQQKQVLKKDGKTKKKKEDFSKQLRKHKNELVNKWEEDQASSQDLPPVDDDDGDDNQQTMPKENATSFDTAEMEHVLEENDADNNADLTLDIPDVSGDDLLATLDDELKNIEAEDLEAAAVLNGVERESLGAEEYASLMNGCLSTPTTTTEKQTITINEEGSKIDKDEGTGSVLVDGVDYGDIVQSGTDDLMSYVDKIEESTPSGEIDKVEDSTDSTEPIETKPQDDGNVETQVEPSAYAADAAHDDPFSGMEEVPDTPMKPRDKLDNLNPPQPDETPGETLSDNGQGIMDNSTDTLDFNEGAAATAAAAIADDFGSFGNGAPATEYSTPEEAATAIAEDFVDFENVAASTEATATTTEPNDNNGKEIEVAPSGYVFDDGFGEFDNVQAAPPTSEAIHDTTYVSDFEAVDIISATSDSSLPHRSVEDTAEVIESDNAGAAQPIETEVRHKNAESRDFGASAAAPTIPTTSDSAPPCSSNDDNAFGSFDNAPTIPSESPGTLSENVEEATSAAASADSADVKDGGDFGGFGDEQAIAPAVSESVGVAVTATASADSDSVSNAEDFGGFSDAPATTPTTTDTAGDFGSFDAGPSTASSTASPTNDGNDFGAFADAHESTSAIPEPANDTVNFGALDAPPPTASSPVPPTYDPDEFADFADAPTPTATESTTDNMNGFGAFDAAPPASLIVPASNDDDDFGGFEDAQAASSLEATTENSDDFGTFDTAPAAAEVITPAASEEAPEDVPSPAVPPNIVNDEDDGFQAFENGPSTASPIEAEAGTDNAVEEFGSFDAQQTSPAPTSTEDDAFGDFDNAHPTASSAGAEALNDSTAEGFGAFDAAQTRQAPADTENDDSGDFDKTPAVPENADGDFGAFDTAPTPQAVPSTDDDDFRDFNNVPATADTTAIPEVPGSMGNGDFGAFDNGPATADTTPASEAPATADDGDAFGDFGTAPASADTAAPEALNNTSGDDDFGDFDAAPASTDGTPAAASADDSGFGDFDKAPASTDAGASVGNDDDDFGDFGAAPVSNDTTPASANDDDFGDFGEAPASNDETPASVDDHEFGDFGNATVTAAAPASVDKDDDFGDFDNAPVATTPAIADHDDFGDFDSAPAPTNAAPVGVDDDDFGDFDDAPATVAAPASVDDDDDFGDFDNAPTTAEKIVDDSDGFGDFDNAPSSAPPPSADNDDWGDFDDAQASTPAAPKAPTAAASNVAGDDFGKFDNAPAASAVPPADAEFGDFGSSASEPLERAPSIDGPELQKARAVLGSMKDKYPFDDFDAELDQDFSKELSKASLQNFLVYKEKKNDISAGEAESMSSSNLLLKEVASSRPRPEGETTKSSKFIVRDDGRGSYFHFVYPVGGLRPTTTSSGREEGIQQGINSAPASPSSKKVPVVLNIDLPTGNEMPLSVSSPKKGSPNKVKSIQHQQNFKKDAPPLPALDIDENGGRSAVGTTSEAVKRLASKIPDLSFMLQSKLVLPQK